MTRRRDTTLRVLISVVALAALSARAIWPNLRLDSISLGLLVVAAVPWLSGLFESLEFPGGWKVSFRKLEAAAAAIPVVTTGDTRRVDEPSYLDVRERDPNLALVGLRIEIEKRLRNIAERHGVESRNPSVGALMRALTQHEVIPGSIRSALEEIIRAGNAAAHGARVPDGVDDFAFTEGPRILAWLDEAAVP